MLSGNLAWTRSSSQYSMYDISPIQRWGLLDHFCRDTIIFFWGSHPSQDYFPPKLLSTINKQKKKTGIFTHQYFLGNNNKRKEYDFSVFLFLLFSFLWLWTMINGIKEFFFNSIFDIIKQLLHSRSWTKTILATSFSLKLYSIVG
jgi:hypothetical protein